MQNPKDISDPTTTIDMALVLMAKVFTLNDTTPIKNNQRSPSNPSNMQIAQPGMNINQDRQMLMVEDNVGNHFRLGLVLIQGLQISIGLEMLEIRMGLVLIQYRIGNVVTAHAKGNGNGINGN
ncbi:hypothetical protein Tco_0806619 [Tanacetum coccineum]